MEFYLLYSRELLTETIIDTDLSRMRPFEERQIPDYVVS